jgi:hypothetical protein
MRAACASFVFTTTMFAVVAPHTAFAAQALAPHRAVYDLTLDEASDRSGIKGIDGRMVYEFDGSACDGYTVNFRFVTEINTGELSRISDLQTSTYEDGAGDNFSFVTKSYVDQKLDREIKGNATRDAGGVAVELDKPDQRSLDLERSQFPTEHLLELIGRAESSETFYETTIFDGSEDADRIMTTTVIIGRKAAIPAGDPDLKVVGALSEDRFWPVDIAYFDLSGENGEEVPSYRISFKLHETGITRDIVMDYGDFSLAGQLVQLDMLPEPECSR